jgi:hypothetical protein
VVGGARAAATARRDGDAAGVGDDHVQHAPASTASTIEMMNGVSNGASARASGAGRTCASVPRTSHGPPRRRRIPTRRGGLRAELGSGFWTP